MITVKRLLLPPDFHPLMWPIVHQGAARIGIRNPHALQSTALVTVSLAVLITANLPCIEVKLLLSLVTPDRLHLSGLFLTKSTSLAMSTWTTYPPQLLPDL